ncbi:GntR family transcriptional regulator [Enterococcus sp. LJL90]
MMDQPKKKIILPRYQQISVAIAERIAKKTYQVGEKIQARSTIATNFNVSPETARKAISVLVDLGIMEMRHGSGAYVISREKAQLYYEQYQDVQSIQEIKNEILSSVAKQKTELDNVTELMNQLVSQMKQVHNFTPFVPYELTLNAQALHLGETIQDLNIWHETGVTIVAIQSSTELLLSPGPYAKLNQDDTLLFVGSELGLQRMQNFFYPNN